MASNVEELLKALINDENIDLVPQTNIEHFLKECTDRVDCGNCPEPKSRVDILLIQLRDKLISGDSGGSSKVEQQKSVNITSNGTTEVLPDTGKTLSKVTINTNVAASGDNKLPQFIDGTLTTITADDLAGITEVRDYAFYHSEITNITLPDTATEIGLNAFDFCSSLTSINIPDGVTSIGSYALEYCSSLTSITIPANVTTIGSNALKIGSLTNKATITMEPTTPPSIWSNTFNAGYLNKIIVPAGCGEVYKAATNWAAYADYIEEESV